jgi:16S rRNA (guanine527-N7)-methyltransferase
VSFADELDDVLPGDLPNRNGVIAKSARHLDLIVEANRQFNLTRITDTRSAAIKHVLDSVISWRRFEQAQHVLDVGTGAGFPGLPLAVVLPSTRFTLSESTGKKARFVESAVKDLALKNVKVAAVRAEEFLRTTRTDFLTARAVAPIERFAALFAPALRRGARALLYKGPDADAEITAAQQELRRLRLTASIVEVYELPESFGSRTIVEIGGA